MNERILRPVIFILVGVLHVIILFFAVFNIKTAVIEQEKPARVMKLSDFAEVSPLPYSPPAPPPVKSVDTDDNDSLPKVETIAENMIETSTVPAQTVVAAGTLLNQGQGVPGGQGQGQGYSWEDYLPMHRVSQPPRFDEKEIAAAIVYPPIAQRSGIEGRVILELFVDKDGIVRRISVLAENPADRGFAEAAVRAFTGKRGSPAIANGEPVSTRYRYPVSFRIK